jgi:DNA-binding transcriptional regulator YiaG
MVMAPQPDLTNEVNTILDIAMRDLDAANDYQLARKLNVSGSAIKKWRKGLLSPSSRALLPLLIQQHGIDVSKPRRRRKLPSRQTDNFSL